MFSNSHGAAVIVVHSHLRWDFVWQRPQQILSRLAETAHVIFVEEPLFSPEADTPRFEQSRPACGVTRVVPVMPTVYTHDDQALRLTRAYLCRAIRADARVTQWFYTPMPAPIMLGALHEHLVVYDCMDELSAFRYAPTDLAIREALLLAAADVVFVGGRRLWESKVKRHHNAHLFGCGVDVSHFSRVDHPDTVIPSDVAGLPEPRLGYVGVIDERLDYQLLQELARANRIGSIVMVGPVVKVHSSELPAEPNIRWLGQRPYDALPAYIKSFDVCLMPFALNEATAYINPTKTLEYMAAGRPVVSTAVPDVVAQFASIVRIARSRRDFVREVKAALEGNESDRIRAGRDLARRHSWDSIVTRMHSLMLAAAAVDATNSIVA